MADIILIEELRKLVDREEYRPALFKSNEEREKLLENYWIPVRSKIKLLDAYMPTRCSECRKQIWITDINGITYYRHGEAILKLDTNVSGWASRYLTWMSLQHRSS